MKKILTRVGLSKISSVGVILGGVATIAGILSMSVYFIVTIAAVAFVLLTTWAFLYIDQKQLPDIPCDNDGLVIRPIKTAAEFKLVDEIYHNCFGESSVPTEVLKSWWLSYHKGIIGLFFDSEIVGGLSIWSLNDSTFDNIRKGHIKEREILSSSIDNLTKNKWYISEIAIIKEHRNLKTLGEFLTCIVDYLNNEIGQNYPATILALAYSKEGRNLLKRTGFIMELNADQTPDKQPLYSLNIENKETLEKIKERVMSMPQRPIPRVDTPPVPTINGGMHNILNPKK
jgi:hypothetical protein